ncbi:signal transduction histidine kinase [Peribacillus deserti]|uniref:histidine kinase n=2 Tax=Peribacillus deserti TaxID=673318 RepID=A0ABS2QDA2_9BACI|nr:signal transduction histidine kinase [Peribacillus deserti]
MLDQLVYICVYWFQVLLVLLIVQLDFFERKHSLGTVNILYILFLSLFIFSVFILIDYTLKKKFFNKANQFLNDSGQPGKTAALDYGGTREQKEFVRILKKLQSTYLTSLMKNEKKQQEYLHFMNVWIHQMKTPAFVISLLLEKERKKEMEAAEILESISQENERILQGLDLVLHVARYNEFEKDYKVEYLELETLVRNLINVNKKVFIRHSIYPVFENRAENALVQSDKKWLEFIIHQLLNNSIKYTKLKDSDKKQILFLIKIENHQTILSIKDNGIGIPRKDIKRVFEPFFTGENGRVTHEATGMGLFLTKQICDKLGHGVQISSTEGQGTAVTILFSNEHSYFDL